MSKTIEDVFTVLEGLEGGDELVQAVKGELTKKNNEAQNLRKRMKEAEGQKGTLSEKIAKAAEKLGLDFDAEDLDSVLDGHTKAINDLKKAAENAKKGAKAEGDKEAEKLAEELSKMTDQMAQIQKDLAKEKKRADEFEGKFTTEHTKRVDSMKSQAIIGALSDSKAVKPAQLVKILLPNVKLEEGTDALLFVNEKGEEVPLKDGVKDWLGANPEFVLDNQKPGGGSGGGNGGKGADNKLQVTRAQLKDTAFYREHQKDILANNYTIIDD